MLEKPTRVSGFCFLRTVLLGRCLDWPVNFMDYILLTHRSLGITHEESMGMFWSCTDNSRESIAYPKQIKRYPSVFDFYVFGGGEVPTETGKWWAVISVLDHRLYQLLAAYHLLPTTYCLLPATYYLLPTTYYSLLALTTYCLLRRIRLPRAWTVPRRPSSLWLAESGR